LTRLDREFQKGSITFNALLDRVRELRVSKIIVFNEKYSKEQIQNIETMCVGKFNLIYKSDEGSLWKIPPLE
jgi:hypothetical protein